MREWYRRKTPEQRRAWIALRDREKARARDLERHERKKGDPQYMTRRAAIFALNSAVKAGRIVREACERCGHAEAQGHHDDYSKPLDVRWLCTLCHAAEHAPEAATT
jgi:ribosomal protein S27AE